MQVHSAVRLHKNLSYNFQREFKKLDTTPTRTSQKSESIFQAYEGWLIHFLEKVQHTVPNRESSWTENTVSLSLKSSGVTFAEDVFPSDAKVLKQLKREIEDHRGSVFEYDTSRIHQGETYFSFMSRGLQVFLQEDFAREFLLKSHLGLFGIIFGPSKIIHPA